MSQKHGQSQNQNRNRQTHSVLGTFKDRRGTTHVSRPVSSYTAQKCQDTVPPSGNRVKRRVV
jgi:hypothetical protein